MGDTQTKTSFIVGNTKLHPLGFSLVQPKKHETLNNET